MGDPLEGDRAAPSVETDHLVSLVEEQLGEVGAVLSGDPGDERLLSHRNSLTYREPASGTMAVTADAGSGGCARGAGPWPASPGRRDCRRRPRARTGPEPRACWRRMAFSSAAHVLALDAAGEAPVRARLQAGGDDLGEPGEPAERLQVDRQGGRHQDPLVPLGVMPGHPLGQIRADASGQSRTEGVSRRLHVLGAKAGDRPGQQGGLRPVAPVPPVGRGHRRAGGRQDPGEAGPPEQPGQKSGQAVAGDERAVEVERGDAGDELSCRQVAPQGAGQVPEDREDGAQRCRNPDHLAARRQAFHGGVGYRFRRWWKAAVPACRSSSSCARNRAGRSAR